MVLHPRLGPITAAIALVACACGEDPETGAGAGASGGGGGSTDACAVGETEGPAGGCCPAGTLPQGDGSCREPGIPPAACGAGFVSDNGGGCEPTLPAAACADGEIAIPGETTCRALMDCGTNAWGNIPSGATSQFVDVAYPNADSDGSAAKPWTSIQQAVNAAADGAVVAVAAGQYLEDITIQKHVRVMGRCPSMVAVVGQGGVSTLVVQTAAADDAELNGLAITGPAIGIVVNGAQRVRLDRLWVHDTGGRGVDLENSFGAAGASLVGSLVEGARDASVILLSADLEMSDSVLRDAEADAGGSARGLVVKHAQGSAVRSHATVDRSVIERTRASGIIVEGSDLTVTGSVVRDILPHATSQWFGRAIEVSTAAGQPGDATIRASVVERAFDAGVLAVGSSLSIETTVVRDVEPDVLSGFYGNGVALVADAFDRPAIGTVVQSTFDRSSSSALETVGCDLTIESVIARDTWPTGAAASDGTQLGPAVHVQDDLVSFTRGHGAIRGSRFERNAGQTIRVGGADLVVESTLVVDTLPAPDGRFGYGIAVPANPMTGNRSVVELHGVVVERSAGVGVGYHESDGLIENVAVRDTAPRASDGAQGLGISVQRLNLAGPVPTLTLRRVLVERTVVAGVAATYADLVLEDVRVASVAAQASDGQFGDAVVTILSTAALRGVQVEQSARVGVSSFGSSINLVDAVLECNPIDLSSQSWSGREAVFVDAGNNRCGCEAEVETCHVIAAGLAPPPPPD